VDFEFSRKRKDKRGERTELSYDYIQLRKKEENE
jgi:hypothetical protein